MDNSAKKEKKKNTKLTKKPFTTPTKISRSKKRGEIIESDLVSEYFPSGLSTIFGLRKRPKETQSTAYFVHNNFIRTHNFKIDLFIKWNLWKPSAKEAFCWLDSKPIWIPYLSLDMCELHHQCKLNLYRILWFILICIVSLNHQA